jgi:CubicO group peptidase (beta-lactamase class C family)
MLAAIPGPSPAQGAPGLRQTVYPGVEWDRIVDPSAEGYSPSSLSALRTTLGQGQTTAMMIVVGGRVLFQYGDVVETSYVASARKSLVSMLYGKYVANGTIPLDKSLRELGIDDKGGLLPRELDATVRDLLSARSGVYHPAANLGDASAGAPVRGSVRHGRYFLYNNWDFNALGSILEREAGRSIYELFSNDIAKPIGLQDWKADPRTYAQAIRNDTGLSHFPAHHFVLSTRDMARLGHLMLQQGRWAGREVIPALWIEESTRLVTSAEEVARTSPFIDGLGYGYLWWVFDPAKSNGTPLDGAYTASGAFGQYITVIPRLGMVIAHKTAVPPPRNVPNERYFGTILPTALALSSSTRPPSRN